MISLTEIVKKIPLSSAEKFNYMLMSNKIDIDYVLEYIFNRIKEKGYNFTIDKIDDYEKLMKVIKFDAYKTIVVSGDAFERMLYHRYYQFMKLFKQFRVRQSIVVLLGDKFRLDLYETKNFKIATLNWHAKIDKHDYENVIDNFIVMKK